MHPISITTGSTISISSRCGSGHSRRPATAAHCRCRYVGVTADRLGAPHWQLRRRWPDRDNSSRCAAAAHSAPVDAGADDDGAPAPRPPLTTPTPPSTTSLSSDPDDAPFGAGDGGGGKFEFTSSTSASTSSSGSSLRATAATAPPPLWPTATPYVDVPPPPPRREPNWCEWPPPPDPLPRRRRIYCNRTLNMRQVRAVGFDLDYTLAQYKPRSFEGLAYANTLRKLVSVFGYPGQILAFEYDHAFVMRGLVVDKRRGNVLKVDRHKYVKLAYHGFKPLPRAARDAAYGRGRDDLDAPHYAMVDTLFSLAETHLFAQLVELADAEPAALPCGAEYAQIWRDVRAAVDLCHRDGTLKREVAADPGRYIHEDPNLVPMLEMLKKSGRRVFLATNSLWDYTNVVMTFLCSGSGGSGSDADGGSSSDGGGSSSSSSSGSGSGSGGKPGSDWLRLFDCVITGCGKPGFFSERRPLFAVDPADGSLRNTDGGAPIVPVDLDDLPAGAAGSTASVLDERPPGAARGPPAPVFQGGNHVDLHRMLGVASGAEVLYVGDHIYGDILRSKKSLGWRTMLVVPELEAELTMAAALTGRQAELHALRAERDKLTDAAARIEWALAFGSGGDAGLTPPERAARAAALRAELAALEARRDGAKARHGELLKAYHEAFHPYWGRLLRTGYQASRYANQITRFACLYTAHATNLAFHAPEHTYRGILDLMAHDAAPAV